MHFNLVICAWSRHFVCSCFKGFVLAPFYKETWVVEFPELWELTSAWFCSNSAMMRRNQPNFLISYLNLWVVLPGSLLEKPLLLILHTNLQAEEHFHGNPYLNILSPHACSCRIWVSSIHLCLDICQKFTYPREWSYCCCPGSWASTELMWACSLKQWVQNQL